MVRVGVMAHGNAANGALVSGNEELVYLALGGDGVDAAVDADFFGEFDEVVGGVAHGGDDDDDLVAALLSFDRAFSGAVDSFCVGDGRAAEFLHDQAHGGCVTPGSGLRV